MKTAAVLAIAAVLLTAAALPVLAGANDTILIGLSASYYGLSQGSTVYGTQPGALDGVDGNDSKWDSAISGAAEVDSNLVRFGFPRDDGRWQIDIRAPLTPNQHKYWDLTINVNDSTASGYVDLTAWVIVAGTITDSRYSARLWLGNTLDISTGRAELLWTAPYDSSGSDWSPQYSTRLLLPSRPPGMDLTLELAQVPEPGSLAALLAGLAGLAGSVACRRRFSARR